MGKVFKGEPSSLGLCGLEVSLGRTLGWHVFDGLFLVSSSWSFASGVGDLLGLRGLVRVCVSASSLIWKYLDGLGSGLFSGDLCGLTKPLSDTSTDLTTVLDLVLVGDVTPSSSDFSLL